MDNVTTGHFTLTTEQRRFKERLTAYPKIERYWDFNKRECDLECLRNDLSVLSSGEAIMARFFCAVWLGENTMDFDLIDAAKSLNAEDLQVIHTWLRNPEFP